VEDDDREDPRFGCLRLFVHTLVASSHGLAAHRNSASIAYRHNR
jgi:hypothetical protein